MTRLFKTFLMGLYMNAHIFVENGVLGQLTRAICFQNKNNPIAYSMANLCVCLHATTDLYIYE